MTGIVMGRFDAYMGKESPKSLTPIMGVQKLGNKGRNAGEGGEGEGDGDGGVGGE